MPQGCCHAQTQQGQHQRHLSYCPLHWAVLESTRVQTHCQAQAAQEVCQSCLVKPRRQVKRPGVLLSLLLQQVQRHQRDPGACAGLPAQWWSAKVLVCPEMLHHSVGSGLKVPELRPNGVGLRGGACQAGVSGQSQRSTYLPHQAAM